MPAAALVLAVTWAASYLVLPSSQLADTAQQIRASALYFQNWQLASDAVNYLQQGSAPSPVQHFWSLSVEEQFYIVWPLLFLAALLIARARAGRQADAAARRTALAHRAAFALTAALVIASLAYSVYDTAANPAQAYFVTTTRMWELGAGGLLALLPASVTERIARHGWLGWAGLAMIIASQFVLNGSTPFPGWIALLPVGGTLALIAGGSSRGRYSPWRLTSARPMTFLGDISYSLYLWHWPIIVCWTTWRGHSPGAPGGILIIVASITLAWLTKVTVEDRVRLAPFFARHNWRSVSTALAAVVPVALVTGYLVSQPGPWDGKLGPGYPGAKVLAAKLSDVPAKPVLPPPDDVGEPGDRAEGCLDGQHAAAPKTCTFGDALHPALKVALVGDSMAGNWRARWRRSPPRSTGAHHRTARHLPVDGHAAVRPGEQERLPDVLPVGHHRAARPDRDDPPRRGDRQRASLAEPTLAHPVEGPQSRADLGAGMATYWKDLETHGISVIGIQETPNMGTDGPACVAKHGAAGNACTVSRSVALPAKPADQRCRT